MIKRFVVVFSKWARLCWTPRRMKGFRSRVAAERFAQKLGDRHPDLRVTRADYHRRRSTVEVVDIKRDAARGGKVLWEHPGVIVPSVGELGWTP